jgi:uncharacterized protein YkwD
MIRIPGTHLDAPAGEARTPARARRGRRRLLLGILCLATAASAGGSQPAGRIELPFDGDPAGELLLLVNDARHRAGLSPLVAEPALASVAAHRALDAARTGDFDGTSDTVMALTRQLRRAGYPPHAWRQRLVQGPRDASALVRQWQSSDPDGFAEVALGDFEGFGAALATAAEPPVWSLFVALPRITWERRLAAPLDDLTAVRSAVLAEVNRERAGRGLAPLALDSRLEDAAQSHAADMQARRFYAHVSPDGRDLGRRASEHGYAYRWVGENIAKGLFEPAEVVRRWMLSDGHRRNILDPHPIHAGIGVMRGEEGGMVTAYWVLDLGRPGPG